MDAVSRISTTSILNENSTRKLMNFFNRPTLPERDQLDETHLTELNILFKKIYKEMKLYEFEENLKADTISSRTKSMQLFECEIYVNLVMQLLNDLLHNLKFVCCFEQIFEDRKLVMKHLGCRDTEKIYNFLREISQNKTDLYKEQPQYVTDIFHTVLHSSLSQEIPNFIEKISTPSKVLLYNMEEFIRIMKKKMTLIAPKEMIKEKVFHQMYRNNLRILDKIKEIDIVFQMEEKKLKTNLQQKFAVINEHQKSLTRMKKRNELDMSKQIAQSNRIMVEIHQNSEVKQKQLLSDVDKSTKTYKQILEKNIQLERELREKKSIVQQQLQACLNRYDKDVGDRTTELTALQDTLKKAQSEFDVWFVEYQKQETIYLALVQQKENEEKKKHNEKLLLFMMNRAARIVQRAFRKYSGKKKKQKKKGKKSKK